MKSMSVRTVMEQLTDPGKVLEKVYSILQQVDPAFENNLEKYRKTLSELEEGIGSDVSPSSSEYVAAIEKEIAAEMVYIGWLGFQQNIDCFNNPVNALLLRRDYEDIHRERRMHILPDVQEALSVINAFHVVLRDMPEDKRNLTDGINDFISYLETTGYKVVHYFGFLLADSFLYHVIPGYTKDSVTTGVYSWRIEDYLKIDLKPLA